MLNIFICEDNEEQRSNFYRTIQNTLTIENLDMRIALCTGNPFEIIDYLNGSSISGVYFIDIDLKTSINGLELAKEIRRHDPRGFIIFITTHSEMSYMTFLYKVEALDFIIKDNMTDIDLRIRQCILDVYEKSNARPTELQKNFSMKVDDKIISIEFGKILFFETSGKIHKVIVHAIDRQVEFYAQMKDIEERLDNRFIRCHKSYLVNRDNITEIDVKKRIAYMINGEECAISLRLMKGLL